MISQSAAIAVNDVHVEATDGPHELSYFARRVSEKINGNSDPEAIYRITLDALKRSRHSTISTMIYRMEKRGMPEVGALIAHDEGLL